MPIQLDGKQNTEFANGAYKLTLHFAQANGAP